MKKITFFLIFFLLNYIVYANNIVSDIFNGIGDVASSIAKSTSLTENQSSEDLKENNYGVKRLTIQDIADAGLFNKNDDSIGLYDIEFYSAEGSSLRGYMYAEEEVRMKIKDFCASRARSPLFSMKVNPLPLMLKAYGEFGFLQKTAKAIFVCRDAQFTEDNKHLKDRLRVYAVQALEDYKVLVNQINTKKNNMIKSINKANEEYYKAQTETYKTYMETLKQPDVIYKNRNMKCKAKNNNTLDCKSY